MTPWQWWASAAVNAECGEWELGEFETRQLAIAAAEDEYPAGTVFYVIEARSSESLKFEGADIVPFLRSRNKERLIAQGIEAGTGETERLDPQGESPVRKDAPHG